VNEERIVLFDGVCNYCNRQVNLIIRRDKKKKFKFAPLQGTAGQRLLNQFNLPTEDFHSFILIENGKVYQRSAAALKLYNQLPWYWKWMQAGWILPRFIRDGLYNLFAKNRYKWFGKKDACMIPAPGVRERFIGN
jgi:predicted DCC family thiol-disulfide oxidoreductase YuxK